MRTRPKLTRVWREATGTIGRPQDAARPPIDQNAGATDPLLDRHPWAARTATDPPPNRYRSATAGVLARSMHRGLGRTRFASNHADKSPIAHTCQGGRKCAKTLGTPEIPLPNRYHSATPVNRDLGSRPHSALLPQSHTPRATDRTSVALSHPSSIFPKCPPEPRRWRWVASLRAGAVWTQLVVGQSLSPPGLDRATTRHSLRLLVSLAV